MDRTLPRLAALIALGGLAIPHYLAAQLTPVGPAVRVDTLTGQSPICPHLAVGADRSFEIAWDYGVFIFNGAFGRHVSPSGEPSSDAQVPLGPNGSPVHAVLVDRVTPLADGFQVFFRRTNPFDIPDDFRQLLDLDGNPVETAELLGRNHQILAGPGGDPYAVVYRPALTRLGIQRVAPGGTLQGPRIILNTRPIAPALVTLAPFANGDFVAGWLGFTTGTSPQLAVRARLVHQGVPVGQDFDLSPAGPPGRSHLLLATGPSTQGFAAVWLVDDGSYRSIHLRFFDSSGQPRTPEIVAVPNSLELDLQSAALDAAGNLLLLWQPPLRGALRARLFSASTGAPLGPAYQLVRTDSYTCGEVAWAGDSWLIAYRASGESSQGAIVWQRFTE